jgi:hypothetical protein
VKYNGYEDEVWVAIADLKCKKLGLKAKETEQAQSKAKGKASAKATAKATPKAKAKAKAKPDTAPAMNGESSPGVETAKAAEEAKAAEAAKAAEEAKAAEAAKALVGQYIDRVLTRSAKCRWGPFDCECQICYAFFNAADSTKALENGILTSLELREHAEHPGSCKGRMVEKACSDCILQQLEKSMDDDGNSNCTCAICRQPLLARFSRFDKGSTVGQQVAALIEIVKHQGSDVASFRMTRRLCKILKSNPEHRVRTQAAVALKEITSAEKEHEQMVEVCLQCLHDERFAKDGTKVQKEIANAMAKPAAMGHGQRIVSFLSEKMLKSKDVECRRAGLIAFPLIFPAGHEEAANSARCRLEDDDEGIRWHAVQSLAILSQCRREQPAEVIEALCKLVDCDTTFVRNEALKTLKALLQPEGNRACEDLAWKLVHEAQQKTKSQERKGADDSTQILEKRDNSLCRSCETAAPKYPRLLRGGPRETAAPKGQGCFACCFAMFESLLLNAGGR